MKDQQKLSVIVPVTERVEGVTDVCRAYLEALNAWTQNFELIYVVDGEFSEIYSELCQLREGNEKFWIIKLAKSFGEATALTAGFENSSGDLILSLPAYLQVDPSELPGFLDHMATNDMIVARRWPRTDSFLNRAQARVFHWLVRLSTGSTFSDLGCGVRAFRREVMDEISVYGDQHRFLPLLATKQGFKVEEIRVRQDEHDRFTRVYPPGMYLRRLLDLLTVFFLIKFTKKPLRFFGLIGSAATIFGGLVVAFVAIERLFLGVPLADRPALLLGSLLMVLGIQIFGLGLIGELIIYTHAKDVKEYTIERIVN